MAINDTTKLDSVFKRTKSKAETSILKAYYEESVGGGFLTDGTDVLADPLPFNDPAAAIVAGLAADAFTVPLRLTNDPTVAGTKCYQARTTYGDLSSAMLVNWIPPRFGITYSVRLFKNDPAVPANEIPSSDASNWFFDEKSGVLIFQDAPPAHLSLWIKGYYYIGRTVMDIAPATGLWARSTGGGIDRIYPNTLTDAVAIGANTVTAGDILRVVGKSKFDGGPVDSINQADVEDRGAFRVLFDVPEIVAPATHTSGYEVKLNSVDAGTDPGIAVCGFFYNSAITDSSPMNVYPFIFEHLMNDSNGANGYYGTLWQAGSGAAQFLSGYATATGTGNIYGVDLQTAKTAGAGGNVLGSRFTVNVSAGVNPVQVYGHYLPMSLGSKAGGGTARAMFLSLSGAATYDQGIYCSTASAMTSFLALAGAGAVATALDMSVATNVSILLNGGTVKTANYAVTFINDTGSGYQATLSGASTAKRGVNIVHSGASNGYAAFAGTGSWARGVYLQSNYGATSGVTYAWAVLTDHRLGTNHGELHGVEMDLRDVCTAPDHLTAITGANYIITANNSLATTVEGVTVYNVSSVAQTFASGFYVRGNWQTGLLMENASCASWAIDCGAQAYNGIRVTNAATGNTARYAAWLSSNGVTAEGTEGTSGGTLYAAASNLNGTAGTFVHTNGNDDDAFAIRGVNVNGSYAKFYGHTGPRTRSGVTIRGQVDGILGGTAALLDIQPRSSLVGSQGILVKNFANSTTGDVIYPIYASHGANVTQDGGVISAVHLNTAKNPGVLSFNAAIHGYSAGAFGVVGSIGSSGVGGGGITSLSWNAGTYGYCANTDSYAAGAVGVATSAGMANGVIGRSYCISCAVGDEYSAGVLGIATSTAGQYTCGVRARDGRFALYAEADAINAVNAGYFLKSSKSTADAAVKVLNLGGASANSHGLTVETRSTSPAAAALHATATNGSMAVYGYGGSVSIKGLQNLAAGTYAGWFEKLDNSTDGYCVYIINSKTTGATSHGVYAQADSVNSNAGAGYFRASRGATGVYIYGSSGVDSVASALDVTWAGRGTALSGQYGADFAFTDCYTGMRITMTATTATRCTTALRIDALDAECVHGIYIDGGFNDSIYATSRIQTNLGFNVFGANGYGLVTGTTVSFTTAAGKVATMTIRGGMISAVTIT